MRAEKPEKMRPSMQVLELIDELKTRKNGDDMSWDGFKHIVSSYPAGKSSTTTSTSISQTPSGMPSLSLSRSESSSRASSRTSMTQVCEQRKPLSEP